MRTTVYQIGAALLLILSAGTSLAENRSMDGSGNNAANPLWGNALTPLLRTAPSTYDDALGSMVSNRPGARVLSNLLCTQLADTANELGLSDFIWQWGQFIDHDMTLVLTGDEAAHIPVPAGDLFFDPETSGVASISFSRSLFASGTGVTSSNSNPRQHINILTAYLDGSQVYGSDTNRAGELRTFTGGKMKTSAGNLLPFNTNGVPNFNEGPTPDSQLFLGGDLRVNEQIGLTAMHTLFVREHNRICDELISAHPGWNDEELYQRARKLVGALIQVITFEEFLPALLGPAAPSPTGGYDTNVKAAIESEFAGALFRVGHTMISSSLMRLGNDNLPITNGALSIQHSFFNPGIITNDPFMVDYLLKGLAARRQQNIDTMIIDDLRNFLFGPPGAGGFDLASLNLQRGRDHGLSDYNTVRQAYGLAPKTNFAGITSDADLQQSFSDAYGSVTNIDLWLGGLAEDHLPGAAVGELIATALSNQFVRLRDGDRFWYGNDPEFSTGERAALASTRLSDILRRNTAITVVQDDVFHVIPEAQLSARMNGTWTGIDVAWMGLSNASYRLQSTDDLTGGSWSNTTDMIWGYNVPLDVTNNPAASPQRYYRIHQYP